MPAPKRQPRRDSLTGFALRVVVAAGLSLMLFALALFLWHSIYVLILIFLGLLIAVFLRGLADWLNQYIKVGPTWSLVIVVFALLLLSVGGGFLIAAPLSRQAEQLSNQLPQSFEKLKYYINQHPLGQRLFDENVAERVMPATQEVVRRATGWITQTFTVLAAILIVFFTGLYLAINPRMYIQGLLLLLPRRTRARGSEVFFAVGYTLQWWLVGRVVGAVVVGVVTAVSLWLLGIPLALVLGALAGLLEFIPNIGPFIAAVPALLLALTIDPSKVIYVGILYIAIQQLESYFLTPMIERKAVSLPPVLTISAQVLLGLLLGVPGLLIATPLMAIVLVTVKMLYVEDVLGEELDTPDDQLREAEDGKTTREDAKSDIDVATDRAEGTTRENGKQDAQERKSDD